MFMYLALQCDRDGRVQAKVLNHGSLQFSSLGGPNSKSSNQPFAVFEINEFIGLECIDDDSLYDELLRRFSAEMITKRIGWNLTNEQLLEMLERRVNGK